MRRCRIFQSIGGIVLMDFVNNEDMVATLIENQRLMNENPIADIAKFKRISIPLVRRIYPPLIANNIVSVQPLLGPTGLNYYLRHQYSINKKNQINDNTWTVKSKKKKIWRDIDEPWEPSDGTAY